jgi:hypothetical protein
LEKGSGTSFAQLRVAPCKKVPDPFSNKRVLTPFSYGTIAKPTLNCALSRTL